MNQSIPNNIFFSTVMILFLCSIAYGLGSGSDHFSFNQLVGSSNMVTSYTFDSAAQGNMGGYPLYHTSYEVFSMMKKFVDPDFTVSCLLGFKFKLFNIKRSISYSGT